MAKRVILAVAGAGKTYHICHEIDPTKRNLILAFTHENIYNIQKELCDAHGCVPELTTVSTFDSFSQGALYEIGSFMSLFTVKNYADEFLAALDKGFKKSLQEEDESVGATAEEIIESTKDFILKEISRQLKGYDLEEFVADLLQAMGYRTTVSPHGGDSGTDITAYKDELPPRILVQVKSQDGDIKETTIQSLKGAMREGDYGLFVTLSNYTKNAKKYLESTPIIRGINGTELVELVLKYYGQLSEKYRKMIPLKMVYIPVTLDTDSN